MISSTYNRQQQPVPVWVTSLLAFAILLQDGCSSLLCPSLSLSDVITLSCYYHPFHLSQSPPPPGISDAHFITLLQEHSSKFGISASPPFSYPHLPPPLPIASPDPQPLLCWFHHLLLSSVSSHTIQALCSLFLTLVREKKKKKG